MTDTVSLIAAERADVVVRDLRESDLSCADAILRSAFDTFTGVTSLFGDKDYVHTRWLADPGAAFAAEHDGQLAGTNFVTRWGTVGFFGPLSVRPELWGQGVASRLMEATVALFDRWGTLHAGLFTFAHSPKHHGLYQKFGFWPRFLTPVMTKAPVMMESVASSSVRSAAIEAKLSTSRPSGAIRSRQPSLPCVCLFCNR